MPVKIKGKCTNVKNNGTIRKVPARLSFDSPQAWRSSLQFGFSGRFWSGPASVRPSRRLAGFYSGPGLRGALEVAQRATPPPLRGVWLADGRRACPAMT